MATTTINTVSTLNTPQAVDDSFTILEHDSLLTTFDVMSNDLGGNAKTLWAITAGSESALVAGGINSYGIQDLLSKDTNTFGVSVFETTELGAQARIINGKIEYDASGLAAQIHGLGVDDAPLVDHVTYSIRLANGTLSLATLTVTIKGQNDAVVLVSGSTTAAGSVTEDTKLIDTGAITFSDADLSDTHTVSVTASAGNTTSLGTLSVDQTNLAAGDHDVQWTYNLHNADAQYLGADDTATETYAVKISDGHGGEATQNVTITIHGNNDEVTFTAYDDGDVSEGDDVPAARTTSGSTSIHDADASDSHSYSISVDGALGSASVDDDGTWHYTVTDAGAVDKLGAGKTTTDTFTVLVDDGHGSTAEQAITVTIHGTNDLATVSDGGAELTEGNAASDLDASGQVTVSDVDTGEAHVVAQTDVQGKYGLFSVDADGNWSYASNVPRVDPDNFEDNGVIITAAHDELRAGEVVYDTFTVDSVDGTGHGTVTIKITGTNDDPTFTDAIGSVLSVTEDGPQTAQGILQVSDPDAFESGFDPASSVTGAAGANGFGTFTFNAVTGVWSYVLDNSNTTVNHLHDNDVLTDSLTVKSVDGTEHTIDITINGVNDAPEKNPDLSIRVPTILKDHAYLINATSLTGDYIDAENDTLSVENLSSDHGTITDNGDGTWTLIPEENFSGTVVLSYDVTDGHGGSTPATKTMGVRIVNIPATISGDVSASITEDAVPNTVTGNLNSTDPDGVDDHWLTTVNTAPVHGSVTIDSAGNWVYTLNNGDTAVNALNNGDTLPDSFVVSTFDGTLQTVQITINGHSDVLAPTAPLTYTGSGDPNDNDFLDVANIAGSVVNVALRTTGNNADTVHGSNLDDSISTGNGADIVYGHGGNDNINGQNGNDTQIFGQLGNDTITGGGGNDTLYGGTGLDFLYGGDNPEVGGSGQDTLFGGSGNDFLFGQDQADNLYGGYGADQLSGGTNSDTFFYLSTRDTNDTITDFVSGTDKIDLSAIDADPIVANDQAFGFNGTTAGAHMVWYLTSAGSTVVYADTDGNASTAELMITLSNGAIPVAGDFVL